MKKPYKYEKHLPRYYNITSKLVDENVEGGNADKIAIYYKDKTYTYREIQAYINQVGNALHILGVRQDERVMLVMKDTPEAVASFYAAIKIGAIPIFVNYMYTADDFRYLLNDSRARTLIADEEFIETIEQWREKHHYLKTTVIVGKPHQASHISFHDIVNRCSDKLNVAHTTTDDAAFWNYTSGSTGTPKGAVHLQHDIFTCIDNYAVGVLGLTSNDILLSASKTFFAYGLGNTMFYPFGVGAAAILLPDRPFPETIFETISKYHPTVFFGVPTLYASLLQVADAEQKYDLSSLRICTSAGEALPKEIYFAWKKRFGLDILDGIGSTEILHIFISNHPGDVKPGSSGKLVRGYSAKIIDDEGHEVPDGEIGTLHIKGESIAAFYWRHHDKTKASMLGEWFNTGDQYYRDKEGYYYYCGRGDDMLKVGGIWVSPIEVEEALLAHPAVLQAAVVAKKDANNLIKPKAFVVLKNGYEPSEALGKEIQLFVKKSIAPYKFPRWIEFVQTLPMTETGKIQRYKLRER
ncbi:MAG: benzoate-CoA ligase family protein [Deltaproteobacteria bacterium]|nr:benzoate-CoA ligase family protein [Deltaproteobacteria bacterium]